MLDKQPVPITFARGVDTKTDPKQVMVGKFLNRDNTVFDLLGALKKRNGFQKLPTPNNYAGYVTTFNSSLTGLGLVVQSYSAVTGKWTEKGAYEQVRVGTAPLIRNSLNQTQADAAVSANGLVCTVYTESTGSSTVYKFSVSDQTTLQSIIGPTLIPVASGAVTGSPRVFVLPKYFVIVFTNVISAVNHLQYITISTSDPSVQTTNADIAATYTPSSGLSWDGAVSGVNLYVAYNTTAGGQAIKVTYLSQDAASRGAGPVTAVTFASQICTLMSVCVDSVGKGSGPIISAAYYDGAGSTGNALSVDINLNTVMSPTQIIASGTIYNITCAQTRGVLSTFYEISNNYSYDSAIASHFVSSTIVTLPATVTTGTAAAPFVVVRSVGLASKAFLIQTGIYFLAEYQSAYQPTYFLISATNRLFPSTNSTSAAPVPIAKYGYQNGGTNASNASQGYLPLGLPGVSIPNGDTAYFAYLYKDLVEAVSKQTAGVSSTAQNPVQTANIYSQTGITLGAALFAGAASGMASVEIGSNLNLSGGFIWAYDGYQLTEQGFLLWPDSVEVTTATGAGSLSAQQYFYQFTYEWTDNQGNVHRSAPSIPVSITTTTSSSTNTIKVPTLRLTYKTNVKIVGYRWSAGQQVYYQFTSLSTPALNDTTVDVVTITDTAADASILGGNIIYTTGGVVENIGPPSSRIMTLFDNRFWLVDAEDRNLLWFSKQVIESTPVEMSDLLTFYVAPTTGVQGSTGVLQALAVMDDKLVLFKSDAIYYITGTGPDNTGANNQYNGPVFITSTVGCAAPQSIVMTPSGLMFQSDKGIWILGRDLSVQYVGADVERYTAGFISIATAAIAIPGTNEVRFMMNSGITLLYDYYVGQWGTSSGIGANGISATVFQGLHTFVSLIGTQIAVYQETPGLYQDGSSPVLMSFETSEINAGGLQGYQRAYMLYLLGSYLSPHLLNVQIAYDYEPGPSQQVIISPTNYTGTFGSDVVFGETTPYAGPGNLEQWRIFFKRQRCQSFRVFLSEIYDATKGVAPGAGLTLSGMNAVVGVKKGYHPQKGAASAGTK